MVTNNLHAVVIVNICDGGKSILAFKAADGLLSWGSAIDDGTSKVLRFSSIIWGGVHEDEVWVTLR